MKANKKLIAIIIILCVVEMISFLLTMKSFSNRNIEEMEEEYIVDKKLFAMYTEQEDGSYKEYNDSNYFPSNGYRINIEKSNCVDNKGNKIEGVITGDNNKITVSSNKTTYCYIYFQKSTNLYELCKDSSNVDECITNKSNKIHYISDIWDSTLEGDGYRYVGTNPDNYICFGTTNQEECISDTDKYMYRIIGIFEDETGKQHIKLIKKEALNTAYRWSGNADVPWEESDIYKGINGSYFMTNTSYSYMQDISWTSQIATWNYTATNTKTYENYNLSAGTLYGPHYWYMSSKSIYLNEMDKNTKSNVSCYYNPNTSADCSAGEWTTVPAKLGLMYASDYVLSLGVSTLNDSTYSNASTFLTSWIHLSNNDSTILSTTGISPPNLAEWTMSRYGANTANNYGGWLVYEGGSVSYNLIYSMYSARPVFYLTSDLVLTGGNGSSTNPYTIKIPTIVEQMCKNYINSNTICPIKESDIWNSGLEGDGNRYVGTNPNNYVCFGTTNREECISDTDKYMYRIIGLFNDENGNQHLKLIKKEALNTKYAWESTYKSDIPWEESDLYLGINGSYFYTNTTDYPYMGGTTWTNKITIWNYTSTNTKTYENYNVNGIYGPSYYYNTARTIYIHELHKNTPGQTCYYSSSTIADCSVGEWNTVSSKIGLIYVSDYILSLGLHILNLSGESNETLLKTGWMHITNSDLSSLNSSSTNPPSNYEWTISRYGVSSDNNYNSFYINRSGGFDAYHVNTAYSVRPVFYLEANVKLTNGDGSSTNPFIIG